MHCFILCPKITAADLSVKSQNVAVDAGPKGQKGKKRSRMDDIPEAATEGTVAASYQLLENETKCEAHHGHCFVDRPKNGGHETHRRLSFEELEFWAKKIVSSIIDSVTRMC